jgi:hypothetical protein
MSQPNFTVLRATRFGQPVIIVIDAALDVDRDRTQYPWLLTIQLPMRLPNAAGLCDQAESARLDGLEDSLLGGLAASEYRSIGHVTGNGKREVLLYVRNWGAVSENIRAILKSMGEALPEIEETHDPNWEYYCQFRAPGN